MRILHVIAGDPSGGANRGALALVELQREAGWHVDVLNLRYLPKPTQKLVALAQRRLNALFQRIAKPKGYFNFFVPFLAPRIPFDHYDVLHLHWVAGQVAPALLRRGRGKWVVTLRDEWIFTGGCHYAQQCHGFEQGCRQCPLIQEGLVSARLGRALVRLSAAQKANVFRELAAPLVTIGSALEEKARRAWILEDQEISTIPNYVSPMPGSYDQEIPARDYYLFVTTHLAVRHKGFDLLRTISAPVKVVGDPVDLPPSLKAPNFDFLGPIANREMLGRLMYGARAVLVPSRAEAFGKVVLEAFSVGTPVIALAVDEPARLVERGRSGFLVEEAKEAAFAEAVARVQDLTDEAYHSLRAGAKARYQTLCDTHAILDAHSRLYRIVAGK